MASMTVCAGSLTIVLILCGADVVWCMSLEQASHSGAEPPTPNTASTIRAQNSQQPPPAREGDKTERIWSREEFMELRLTLAALWALQGGLPWHTLHTDNTHGAEHEYSILLVYSDYKRRRRGRDEVKWSILKYGILIVSVLGREGF